MKEDQAHFMAQAQGLSKINATTDQILRKMAEYRGEEVETLTFSSNPYTQCSPMFASLYTCLRQVETLTADGIVGGISKFSAGGISLAGKGATSLTAGASSFMSDLGGIDRTSAGQGAALLTTGVSGALSSAGGLLKGGGKGLESLAGRTGGFGLGTFGRQKNLLQGSPGEGPFKADETGADRPETAVHGDVPRVIRPQYSAPQPDLFTSLQQAVVRRRRSLGRGCVPTRYSPQETLHRL